MMSDKEFQNQILKNKYGVDTLFGMVGVGSFLVLAKTAENPFLQCAFLVGLAFSGAVVISSRTKAITLAWRYRSM